MVDIKYSQNFYKNSKNLARIIKSINFSPSDTILDIGAGNGVITKELLKYSNNIVAYELDYKYFNKLKKDFLNVYSVVLKNKDFLIAKLPQKDFKIFANIPFALTSDIINKITDTDSYLTEAYLFVQKESAERFVGKPKNTQISTILSLRYSFSVRERFKREDFKPIPNVDIVLLKIVKKNVLEKEYGLYRDFVTYIFNQRNSCVSDTFKKLFTFNQLRHIKEFLNKNGYIKPSDIPVKYYLEIFQYYKTNGSKYRDRVNGYYEKHIQQHSKREKVYRTRV
ncbi:TPA: hypothetical protein DEP90_03060 [Patescibacteria group bacterium]|nr:hypothetical protein [Patescibacteria group bacterium]